MWKFGADVARCDLGGLDVRHRLSAAGRDVYWGRRSLEVGAGWAGEKMGLNQGLWVEQQYRAALAWAQARTGSSLVVPEAWEHAERAVLGTGA